MAEIAQKQSLTQSQRQEQTMSYRQIQAIELLFLPVVEIQSIINTELEKNPVLDTELPPEAQTAAGQEESDEWLDKILKLSEENRYIKGGGAKWTREDEEKRDHYLESVTVEQTFQESLSEQLRFLDLDDKTRQCCELVISSLDDDGYLKSHMADIAMAAGQSMENVSRAVAVVQSLEPAGVAAADLRERLLLQLERKNLKDSRAYTAVKDYLAEIAANHLPQVAKKMGLSIEEIKETLGEIQKLSPVLSCEQASPSDYVREEVVVEEDSGALKVTVKNDYLPSLRISPHYRDLLKDPGTPRDTREYIKERLHAGVSLINSVIQRQTTIKKIAGALVKAQESFFMDGASGMRPLTMARIAQEIGIHETTVSRAVAGKYLKCKHGFFPLRHFFSAGFETEGGEAVSNNVIKDAIKSMIASEDVYSPLSDSDIAAQLKERGLTVARRTVAKYRESMNILPSHMRRQY
jgi:RNA polymerase sigma-54 factor